MKSTLRKDRGFTLIEIVVSLIIAGILGSIAALGIAQGTKAFVLSKDNAALSQKAQVALTRLTREFTNLKEVTGVTGTPPDYTGATITILKDGSPVSRTVATSGGFVTIDGNRLADSVSSFVLGLKKADKSDWKISDLTEELVTVELNLKLAAPSGVTVEFFTKMSPRFNENTGGDTNPPL